MSSECELKLTGIHANGRVALISSCDYEWANKITWHVYHDPDGGYEKVRATHHGKHVFLGWMVLDRQGIHHDRKMTVDHIDRNVFNNKRENLRVASKKVQDMNRCAYGKSGLKNIEQSGRRWRVVIGRDKKRYFLGAYDTPAEAIAVRDRWIADNKQGLSHVVAGSLAPLNETKTPETY
jgi:hypothetical protein